MSGEDDMVLPRGIDEDMFIFTPKYRSVGVFPNRKLRMNYTKLMDYVRHFLRSLLPLRDEILFAKLPTNFCKFMIG
jgi:hypothetical protein